MAGPAGGAAAEGRPRTNARLRSKVRPPARTAEKSQAPRGFKGRGKKKRALKQLILYGGEETGLRLK